MEDRFFYDDYIDDELDRIVRENNRIRVFHLTKPVKFKSWFDRLKAVCTCAIKGHVWELDAIGDGSVLYRGFDNYRCMCCGKTKFFINSPKNKKQ